MRLALKGIGTDTPVTHNFKNVPLKSVLQQLLKPLRLAYVLRDEVILIDTPEGAAWFVARNQADPVPGDAAPQAENPFPQAKADANGLVLVTRPMRSLNAFRLRERSSLVA